MTTSCGFWIKFFVFLTIFGALFTLFFGFNHNTFISILISFMISFPILIIDYIYRYLVIARKNTFDTKNYIICPRCKIRVERTTGICPNCKIQL